MRDISGKLGKVSLLEVPENRRKQLFREAKQRLRQRVVEDKMWRWLLDVDRLTINGCTVWRENRRSKRLAARKSRRRRAEIPRSLTFKARKKRHRGNVKIRVLPDG